MDNIIQTIRDELEVHGYAYVAGGFDMVNEVRDMDYQNKAGEVFTITIQKRKEPEDETEW
mgnify:CR=1 FL=1